MSGGDDRWRGLIAAAAVLSFLMTVVSLIVGGRLAGPRPTGVDSYSDGPLGHQVAFKLVDRLGYEVTRQNRAYHDTDVTLFIEPASINESTDFGDVFLVDVLDERSALELASIVVLPKWRLGLNGEVSEASGSLMSLSQIVAPGTEVVWHHTGEMSTDPVRREEHGSLGDFVLELPWRQAIVTPEGFESVLGPEDSSLVVISQDRTRIIVSDPDIFHNFNIQRADHAALIDAIVGASIVGDAAAIDEVFHGHANVPSLGHLLSQFPAVLLVVQGVTLCLLVFLFGFRRFGVPRKEVVDWEHGPLETVEVSANVLALGQSVARLAAEYTRRAIDECAETLGLKGTTVRERAIRLDALMTRQGLEPAAVATLDGAARLSASTRQQAESIRVARRAYDLRTAMLRAPTLKGSDT